MVDLLTTSIICACVSAFLVTLAHKWEITSWMQINGNDLIEQLARCNFCLSFWVSTLLSVFVLAATCDPLFILIPFIATPLARMML